MRSIGAIIGDINGSVYEFCNHRSKNFLLFSNKMFFTDDTVLTIAVMDALLHKKDYTEAIREWAKKYPYCSWGCSFARWLNEKNPQPYNSFGNGAAMRISPVGLIAKDENEVEQLSYEITSITHNHEEGIKGAYITAMCVFYARKGKTKEEIKAFVEKYYDINFNYEDLKDYYYFNETCQDTVPQAIYCFLISKDFEDCIRTSISIGGDSDTLAAISCSIASAYYGVSQKMVKETFKFLPKDMKQIIKEFESKLGE